MNLAWTSTDHTAPNKRYAPPESPSDGAKGTAKDDRTAEPSCGAQNLAERQ
jgi:hypothetical protein